MLLFFHFSPLSCWGEWRRGAGKQLSGYLAAGQSQPTTSSLTYVADAIMMSYHSFFAWEVKRKKISINYFKIILLWLKMLSSKGKNNEVKVLCRTVNVSKVLPPNCMSTWVPVHLIFIPCNLWYSSHLLTCFMFIVHWEVIGFISHIPFKSLLWKQNY